MNANELRIGNYIDLYGSMAKLHPLDYENRCDDFEFKDFKPIELNEEWLLGFGIKFGWDNFDIEFLFNEYNLRYRYDIGSSAFITSIKYVHQLQNLYFSLTGKELNRVDGF